ncbi:MAG: tetratricopeptide repeat protein, partial [Cyanobacteria bacterium]|nr:tetratricopeptide repeat protein [Cyanobacteriota bacterium]
SPVYKAWEESNFAADKARESGNLTEAETLYRTAISNAQKISYSGPSGISYYGLARTLHQQKNLPEAEKTYEKALDILDNADRRRRVSYLVACIKDYCQCLREQGKNDEAKQHEERLHPSLR